MVRLTYHPDMTLDVYRGRKTTIQQQQQLSKEANRKSRKLFQFVKYQENMEMKTYTLNLSDLKFVLSLLELK